MYEHGFWDGCAEAMELSIEGNRLIAQELTEGLRNLWRRATHWLDDSLRGLGQRRHLPPI
jgi:hypothetical protein